jgi:sulfoxide reductase heme-binding subunit YedZ
VTERDPSRYVFWLASRSAGIVAFVLIATSVMFGLYMAANLGRRKGYKRTMVKAHEQVALVAMAMIALHGLLLLGDKWLSQGLGGLLIPFTMSYRPLWTGIGMVAGYLAFALGLTFYVRRRLGTQRWRKVHRLTPIVYMLGAVHALGAGSDGAGIWMQGLVVLTAVPIAGLLAARYRPRGPARSPAPRRPAPAPSAQ